MQTTTCHLCIPEAHDGWGHMELKVPHINQIISPPSFAFENTEAKAAFEWQQGTITCKDTMCT